MNDYAIFKFIREYLLAGFALQSLPSIRVLQKNQPIGQGALLADAIYIEKIMATAYGYPEVRDDYNIGTGKFDTTTAFMRAPTFQISGYALQDVNTVSQLTASDITELAANILQTDAAVEAFQAIGIGIERVTGIRELYFSDDKEQFEQVASFDLVLSYTKEFTIETNKLTAVEVDALRV
jgi:hypothetical protein